MSYTFTDIFCGAGGSSSGLAAAGLTLDLAANHWDRAIESHAANFPDAEHLCADVNNYDMRRLPNTHILWASPICTELSPSGGRKRPKKKPLPGQLLMIEEQGHVPSAGYERTRATFWDVIRATEVHRYPVVIIENVVEAYSWELFDVWLAAMDKLERPMRVFVNSMSDLFHDQISDEYIARVFAVMALAPQHTFQVLTKRHARMRSLLASPRFADLFVEAWQNEPGPDEQPGDVESWPALPLPNVWLGVSVESQQWANLRIPALLHTPAAVRFLSCEPLLGPVNLIGQGGNLRGAGVYALPDPPDYDGGEPICQDHGVERCSQGCTFIGWVIVGGESGPGARPMHPDWARSLRDQCVAAGVPFLFKQWGAHFPLLTPQLEGTEQTYIRLGKKEAGRYLDGRTWDEYPGGEV